MKYRPKSLEMGVHEEMLGSHDVHLADEYGTLDDRCPSCAATLAAHPDDFEPF